MKKAVLLTFFNRPDTTLRVFDAIREAKPPRLYLASDGARDSKTGEKEIVENLRKEVLKRIDWECDVKTLFRGKNWGCRDAMSSSISWFFDNEFDGIILEDDTVPNQSFFTFCENLLDKYKDEKRVMHISGNQFLENFNNGASYYFARIEHCWGWASWADRWKLYKYGTDLNDFDLSNIVKFSTDPFVQQYWINILRKMQRHEINSWAYQWTFRIVENDGLCINPSVNLVSNIGFQENATHTKVEISKWANMPTFEITKIIHPQNLTMDEGAVNRIYKEHFGIKLLEERLKGRKTIVQNNDVILNTREWRLLAFFTRNFYRVFNPKFKITQFLKKVFQYIRKRLSNSKVTIENNINSSVHINNISKTDSSSTEYLKQLFEDLRKKSRFIEGKIKLFNNDFVYPDAVSLAYQIYEIFLANDRRFVPKHDKTIIYDCGANTGITPIYFRKTYPNSKVIAFEPDKIIYERYLKPNLSKYTGIKLYPYAVWTKDTDLEFHSEGADAGSLIVNFNENDKQIVKAIRLRNWLEKEPYIDLLHIDIEGAEIDLLVDLEPVLSKVDNILVEYHSVIGKPQRLETLLKVLSRSGFRYYLKTLKAPFYPFTDPYKENAKMDLQINIFATRNYGEKENKTKSN